MADSKHLDVLKQGVLVWNDWRLNHPDVEPDLSNEDLTWATFSMEYPEPPEKAVTRSIYYVGADLSGTNLRGAKLRKNLARTNFRNADLRQANLSDCFLWLTDFSGALLNQANLTHAHAHQTNFIDTDLSETEGLDSIVHYGPSFIDINTLYKSAGRISEIFLRGCGVPDEFIAYVPSLIGARQSIQFYSCFISYSHTDEVFAKRLHSQLRDAHIRVWFAPEDIRGGENFHEQIERAIQFHDRLLLVLSESSMQSEWVMTEIRDARRIEVDENRRKLFPIRLVDFEAIRKWKCFDAETAKDMAVEMREYFIPDFSNWKDHDAFESAFERLVRDLRDEETRTGRV